MIRGARGRRGAVARCRRRGGGSADHARRAGGRGSGTGRRTLRPSNRQGQGIRRSAGRDAQHPQPDRQLVLRRPDGRGRPDLRGRHRTGQGHRCAVDGLRRRSVDLPRADPLRHRGSRAGAALGRLGAGVRDLDAGGDRAVCGGRPGRRRRRRARPIGAGRLATRSDDGVDLRRLHHRRADLGGRTAGRGRPDHCRSSHYPRPGLERLLPRRHLAVRAGSGGAGRPGRADPAGRGRCRRTSCGWARPARPGRGDGPPRATARRQAGAGGPRLDGQGARRLPATDRQ